MSNRGKKYKKALAAIDRDKRYPLVDALKLAKESSYTSFVGSLDLTFRLGVDPRHADQNVRGAVTLPKGSGKSARIVVFAKGQKALEAKECDVDFVGADDLAEKIAGGWLEFDHIVATPDMMAAVGKLGRVLGPRGLMPNPKLGTVTFDVKTAVEDLKKGKAQYKVDKAGVVHTSIGRTSMSIEDLTANAEALIEALNRAKPSTAKGVYLRSMGVSATMGPGVKIDSTTYR